MGEEESRMELEHQGTPHMPPDTARLCQPSLIMQMRVSEKGTGPGGARGWGGMPPRSFSAHTHTAAQGCHQEAGITPTFLTAQGAREVFSGEGQSGDDERGHRVLA